MVPPGEGIRRIRPASADLFGRYRAGCLTQVSSSIGLFNEMWTPSAYRGNTLRLTHNVAPCFSSLL